MIEKRILYVEDELSLATIVRESMETEGYVVDHARSPEEAIRFYYQHPPDLIVLDIMLGRGNGYQVSKHIRQTNTSIPIIFLSARSRVKDVEEGFESGGNDYMRKPFSTRELLIRIRALLSDRRIITPSVTEETRFSIGRYLFDSRIQVLELGSRKTELTARETQLLKILCEHQDALVPKKTILLQIWEDDTFFNSRSMDVYISRLRKHLKEDGNVRIINLRGEGYKLIST